MLLSPAQSAQAVHRLLLGDVVALPTETVYGLAADATNERAVAAIFELKQRPIFNPLIIHGVSLDVLRSHVHWNVAAQILADVFWPGPLTLVLPRTSHASIALLASAGLDSLAIRVPSHPLMREVLAQLGRPLAAPSANRSGRLSPTTAAHVEEEFGPALPVLDGGACSVGLESTVVALVDTPVILRPGAVTQAMLEAALRQPVPHLTHADIVRSPGQLLQHYAPRAQVRLNAYTVEEGEALLAFGPSVPAGARAMLNLSESGDVQAAAARLFSDLRALDATGVERIAVMPIPEVGMGVAINDRLRRAAAR